MNDHILGCERNHYCFEHFTTCEHCYIIMDNIKGNDNNNNKTCVSIRAPLSQGPVNDSYIHQGWRSGSGKKKLGAGDFSNRIRICVQNLSKICSDRTSSVMKYELLKFLTFLQKKMLQQKNNGFDLIGPDPVFFQKVGSNQCSTRIRDSG